MIGLQDYAESVPESNIENPWVNTGKYLEYNLIRELVHYGGVSSVDGARELTVSTNSDNLMAWSRDDTGGQCKCKKSEPLYNKAV